MTTNRTPFRSVNEIPARLLASDQLKWQKPESDQVIIFTTNGKHFGYEHDVGATSGLWHAAYQELVFRPIGLSWAAAEELVKLPIPASPPSHLPKDGDTITVAGAVAVVKEGCRQALDEAKTARQPAKVGNYSHTIFVNPLPHTRTVIAALPPGRRKYVKLFLKSLGFCNLDKIPTTADQKPYYLGHGLLSAENREKLISLAPNIVLRDVL